MLAVSPRPPMTRYRRLFDLFPICLLAASLAPLVAQGRSSSLHEALEFMAGSLKASGTLETPDRSMRFTELFASSGCTVTVTDRNLFMNPAGELGEPSDISDKYSLAEIDPESIHLFDSSDTYPGSTSVHLDTTNYRDTVVRTAGVSIKMNVANPGFILRSEYVPRFVQALKRAIQLCGGRPSAF
jgi:hypothetical protein